MSTRIGFIASALVVVLLATPALAQEFGSPPTTTFRERITGSITIQDGGPMIDTGDQIAALFEDEVIGRVTFTSENVDSMTYEMLVFGDDPSTDEREGPRIGDRYVLGFYDASRNVQRMNVEALNSNGESVNLRFEGAEVIPIPGLPLDLTPTQQVDIRLTADDNAGGGGGGGGGGGSGIEADVDGDGRITTKDASLVLRIVTGATRGVSADALSRADVDGDGTVSTADAIAVLQAR